MESFSSSQKPISAMLRPAWPDGVATKDDHEKFLTLLFGRHERKDLTDHCPLWSWDRDNPTMRQMPFFLTMLKDIRKVNDLKMIEIAFNIFQDQMNWERQNGNMWQWADKIHDILGSKKSIGRYYRQAAINGGNCGCEVSFGGDEKWKKATCPRDANAMLHGQLFEECLTKNMKTNFSRLFKASEQKSPPWWMRFGTFHVLFNEYFHSEGNSISFHSDAAGTYSELDPICSFTFKSPGVLMVKRKPSGKGRSMEKHEAFCILIFQEPGDVVVMGGHFQQLFEHAVPARDEWTAIHESQTYEGMPVRCDETHWEKFTDWVEKIKSKDERLLSGDWSYRQNCTLRWHRKHFGLCRYRNSASNAWMQPGVPPKPVTPVAIRTLPIHTPWSTHVGAPVAAPIAVGVAQAHPPAPGATAFGAVTVIMPPGMTPMGPVVPPQAQAASTYVRDSAPVSDDRPMAASSLPPWALPEAATAPESSSDDNRGLPQWALSETATAPDENQKQQVTNRFTAKRSHPAPADDSPQGQDDALKKGRIDYAMMIHMQVEILGAKRMADMLDCCHIFQSPHFRNSQIRLMTKYVADIDRLEAVIREALKDGIDLTSGAQDHTNMPSDQWLTSLTKSKCMIEQQLSVLTQQTLLEEFLQDNQWVNVYPRSVQVNSQETRKHLRRCPVKGQAFVDWFKQPGNAFDTQALQEYGWLKMESFIKDSMHVTPQGKQFPATEHFKGPVVLETIDFSISDLRSIEKDVPGGFLQITVLPAPLKNTCNNYTDDRVKAFATRIANFLQSLIFLVEAKSENSECYLNLWIADFDTKKKGKSKQAEASVKRKSG